MQCRISAPAIHIVSSQKHHYQIIHTISIIISHKTVQKKKEKRRKTNLPHEVEIELARLAKALALHNTSNHVVIDSAKVHDGRELIEDQRSGYEVVVFHPSKL